MDKAETTNQACQQCGERKLLGRVSQEDRDELQALFERKNGLTELVYSLMDIDDEKLKNHYFYERLLTDMANTTAKFDQWWLDKAVQYHWEDQPGHVWDIDFASCEVFLRKK